MYKIIIIMDFDNVNIKTECGIFAIYCPTNSNTFFGKTVIGLRTLQHRGQESTGISYLNENKRFVVKKGVGLVSKVFDSYENPSTNIVVGHVRYSTTKKSDTEEKKLRDTQPLLGISKHGKFSIAHNGNIPHLQTTDSEISDSHIIIDLIENSKQPTWTKTLIEVANILKGAYCIVITTSNAIYCMRDRYGYKPLSIGITKTGKNSEPAHLCITSETNSFKTLQEFKHVKDVEPGEILMISGNNNIETVHKDIQNNRIQRCLFEFIYFMKPASSFDGIMVEETRESFGKILANKENLSINEKNKNDYIVVGCPNTGIVGGKSYAKHLGLNYKQVISKRKHMKRTFILPTDKERKKQCREKYEIDPCIANKKLIIVDDSIVRGNTMKILIDVLFEMGCKEIHIRITAPPVRHPCYYGIDIPTRTELIANEKTVEEVKEFIGANSLSYLPIEDIVEMFKDEETSKNTLCTACFTGDYNNDLF